MEGDTCFSNSLLLLPATSSWWGVPLGTSTRGRRGVVAPLWDGIFRRLCADAISGLVSVVAPKCMSGQSHQLCLCRGICLWRWWMCSLKQTWFPVDNQAWEEVATELGWDWQCKIKSQEQKLDVFTHPDSSPLCSLWASLVSAGTILAPSSCAASCCSKHLPWCCYLCPCLYELEPNLLLSWWASVCFPWSSPGRDPRCPWESG